jgi:hypothetical protein
MNDDACRAAEVDAFFDALARDPHATSKTLDEETASVVRVAVAAERGSHAELPPEVRRRIWHRALAGARQERGARIASWRRFVAGPSGPLLGCGVAVLMVALVVAVRGIPGHPSDELTPAQIVAKAQQAATAPSPVSPRSFVTTEVTETRDEHSITRTATTRWHAFPDRWRTESRSTVLRQGAELRGPLTVSVSDGTQLLSYAAVDTIATLTPLRDGDAVLSTRPFGPEPGDTGSAGAAIYTALLQAGHCLRPEIAGSEQVAGRKTFVLKLEQWTCPAISPGVLVGDWRLYVDRETFFVLRAIHRVDGVPRLLAEVRSFSLNPLLRGGTFTPTPPAGMMVYARPAPPRTDFRFGGPTTIR